MANEIQATYDTGVTLYTLVFNAAGQVWRNNAPQQFLAYAPGAIGVYDIPLSEIATDSGQYRANWPVHANMIAGVYSVVLFEQAGGSPVAADDDRIGETGKMIWDGDAEIDLDIIEGQTDKIDDATDGLTAIKAEVEGIGGITPATAANVATALTNYDGPTNAEMNTAHDLLATEAKQDIMDTNVDQIEAAVITNAAGVDIAADIIAIKAETASILDDTDLIDDGTSGLAKIASDVATLLLRLTVARAGYLDELAAANIPADIDTLLTRLSVIRAGYLDELGPTNIPADIDILLARLTVLRAEYLDELAAANIPSDIDDILAKTNLITTGQILVSSPVAADGDVTIVQGDDYLAANGTALEFTSETWTSPDLTSATAKLRFITKENYDAGVQAAALEVDADITWAGSGNDAIFSVDLTAAQTTALSSPTPPSDKYSYVYQLQVTTSAGKKITVALGSVYVKQEIT